MSDANTEPVWREIREPGDVAAALISLYRRKGDSHYDEAVSQNDHARQCAARAMDAGAGVATVVAAFVHDVGHLLMDEQIATGRAADVDRHHEEIGARFLANWFGDDVCTPVRLHVAAKRYLCAVEPAYHDDLSDASVRSLVAQGGPMTADEVARFEAIEHHRAAVELRRWDDAAKIPGAAAPDLSVFERLIGELLCPV